MILLHPIRFQSLKTTYDRDKLRKMWMYFIWHSDNSFNGIEWCLLIETPKVASKYLHKRNSFKIKITAHSVCCALPAPLPHSLASFLLQKQSKRTLSQCIHLERIVTRERMIQSKGDSIRPLIKSPPPSR